MSKDVAATARAQSIRIPEDRAEAEIAIRGRTVHLTNLQKPFWPELRVTKGNLLQYYAGHLLPHLAGRAMVMKRYPNGAHGKFFFMKRAPSPRTEWIRTWHDDGSPWELWVDRVETLRAHSKGRWFQ